MVAGPDESNPPTGKVTIPRAHSIRFPPFLPRHAQKVEPRPSVGGVTTEVRYRPQHPCMHAHYYCVVYAFSCCIIR